MPASALVPSMIAAAAQSSTASQALAHQRWQQGVELKERGALEPALAAFLAAVELDPDDGLYWLNLAHVQARLGRPSQALHAVRRALEIDPLNTLAFELAADQLLAQYRFADAVALLDALAPSAPRGLGFHLRHMNALLGAGQAQRAVEAALAAIGADLSHAPAHFGLGAALAELRMFEEAAQAFRTGWLLEPHRIDALEMSAHRNQQACRWDHFEPDLEAIERAYAQGRTGATVSFALLSLPVRPATLRQSAALAAQALTRDDAFAAGVPRAVRGGGERLRVGYVSNDFHAHATMQLMIEMLESHDRSAFEVTLYAHDADDGSPMRRRTLAACERFVDIAQMSDGEAAARMRADGIDILVDLKGYTRGHRLGIFTRRPAPIQVGFLGYPGTTGSDFLDYFIGDPITTPPSAAPHFSEKLAQMPRCYQPNDSHRARPVSVARADCGLPEGAFVLCSFNQSYKITPRMFDTWCGLLREIPDAVLWLLDDSVPAARNLRTQAALRRVAPERLLFAPALPQEQHLARLQAADLFVDCTPYGAHTTGSDALWVGLPLVTLAGETFASRVAASQLHALGLPDLVATDLEGYAAIVRTLAGERSRLGALRARLAEARETSGLFDGRRFARDIEALFRRMATRHAAGLPPDHLWAQ